MSIPKKLYNISQSQFSVARYSGSAKINGKTYYYNPVDDSLTLDSEMEKVYRLIRATHDESQRDEYIEGEYKTMKEAIKAGMADRSGRLVVVYGPNGIETGTFMRNGKRL